MVCEILASCTVTLAGVFYLVILITRIAIFVCNSVKAHLFTKILQRDWRTTFGEWAVVTGGTDGIGKAYARELASRGINIVIISRNLEKLTTVARDIEEDFKVLTKVIQMDFSTGDAAAYGGIETQLKDMQIGILVNNVGVIVPYPLLVNEMTPEQIWQHVNVNMAAGTILTRMLLPAMQARGRGAIVNFSSLAASAATPYLAVYAASKAFVESFSTSLEFECRGTGVHVQTLNPGYVNTNMVAYSDELRSGGLMVPSAAVFAKHAVATLGIVDNTAGYWLHDLQHWVVRTLVPTWMWIKVAGRLNKNFRKEYDKMQTMKKH